MANAIFALAADIGATTANVRINDHGMKRRITIETDTTARASAEEVLAGRFHKGGTRRDRIGDALDSFHGHDDELTVVNDG